MANKKCLVFETMNNITQSMKIVESSNPKEIRLTGVFGVAGIKNNNNRIYDKQNYGMMVESLQKVIATEGCLGELEHPNSMNIDLNNVSHKIESIEMREDGTVVGTILLIDTVKGKNAKAIVEAGVPLYISSRAAGSIDEYGHVTLTNLKTYDLVGTPGFSQAKLNLVGNQKFESLNESLCVIYEDDDTKDDLLPDDNGDSKSDSTKSDSDAETTKGKAEDKNKEEKKEEDHKDDDENNKNNDDKEVTMQELKEAIDKLSKEVNDLRADLHIANESLENKEAQIKSLTEKLEAIPSINYSAIEKWIVEEYSPSFKEELSNALHEVIDEKINETKVQMADGVQKWVINEFSPLVESYINDEYTPDIKKYLVEEIAPKIESWVVEEFAPEIENWITEEYSPVLEKYITEEFAPTLEGWITEEFAPNQKNSILEEMDGNVKAFLEAKNQEKLSNIDNLLEAIAKTGKTDDALDKLKESQVVDEKYKGVYVVENMPSEYIPQWTMASEEKKQDIIRRSKMYNFTKTGVLESFWTTVDFNEEAVNESAKPVGDTYHNNIFNQMKKLRKY